MNCRMGVAAALAACLVSCWQLNLLAKPQGDSHQSLCWCCSHPPSHPKSNWPCTCHHFAILLTLYKRYYNLYMCGIYLSANIMLESSLFGHVGHSECISKLFYCHNTLVLRLFYTCVIYHINCRPSHDPLPFSSSRRTAHKTDSAYNSCEQCVYW